MAVSDDNRRRFEGIGLPEVRWELSVGNVRYLMLGDQRAQAAEWVAEQEARLERGKKDQRELEARRFRWVLVVAIVAAAAAVIAALPIIQGWIETWRDR